MKTLYFCFWFKNRDKENCNSWQSFSRQYHICYEWPILLRRFLSFHCALNCSLGCFSIPKCAAFGLKGWNLTQNSSVQSVKKSPSQEKKVLEREGLEIGYLRGNLTSGHNTCDISHFWLGQFLLQTLGHLNLAGFWVSGQYIFSSGADLWSRRPPQISWLLSNMGKWLAFWPQMWF